MRIEEIIKEHINVKEGFEEYTEYYENEYRKIIHRLICRGLHLSLSNKVIKECIYSMIDGVENEESQSELSLSEIDPDWFTKEIDYAVNILYITLQDKKDKDEYKKELLIRQKESDKKLNEIHKKREEAEIKRKSEICSAQNKIIEMKINNYRKEYEKKLAEESKALKTSIVIDKKINDEMINCTKRLYRLKKKDDAKEMLVDFMVKYFDSLSLLYHLAELIKSKRDYDNSAINPYYTEMNNVGISYSDIVFYRKCIFPYITKKKYESTSLYSDMPISFKDHKSPADSKFPLEYSKF